MSAFFEFHFPAHNPLNPDNSILNFSPPSFLRIQVSPNVANKRIPTHQLFSFLKICSTMRVNLENKLSTFENG